MPGPSKLSGQWMTAGELSFQLRKVPTLRGGRGGLINSWERVGNAQTINVKGGSAGNVHTVLSYICQAVTRRLFEENWMSRCLGTNYSQTFVRGLWGEETWSLLCARILLSPRRCPICCGILRKEGRKVSLAASGRTRLCQERGLRQCWQVRETFFFPHRPLWLWRKRPGDPGDLCKRIPCNKQGPKPFLKSARMHFQQALWQYQ